MRHRYAGGMQPVWAQDVREIHEIHYNENGNVHHRTYIIIRHPHAASTGGIQVERPADDLNFIAPAGFPTPSEVDYYPVEVVPNYSGSALPR